MPILPRDFKEFLQSFNDHGVEYLLVGGWAVGFHGYPRRSAGQIDGIPTPVIALQDLKTNKAAAGRAKDLADLEELP